MIQKCKKINDLQVKHWGAHRASNDTPSGTWYFGGALGALAAAKESKLVTTGRERESKKMMSKYQKVNDLQVKRCGLVE